jgi:hypothetical protein
MLKFGAQKERRVRAEYHVIVRRLTFEVMYLHSKRDPRNTNVKRRHRAARGSARECRLNAFLMLDPTPQMERTTQDRRWRRHRHRFRGAIPELVSLWG